MFTGIIEELVEVVLLEKEGSNLHIHFKSSISRDLKIDQSISHNGICLTVVDIKDDIYMVTAIKETIEKTNLSELKIGDIINTERCMKLGDRLDGHLVQGHVDQVGRCIDIVKEKGSHLFTFKHKLSDNITVEKGSICVNGASLTVVNSKDHQFSVAVIPYTFEHTNFKNIRLGDTVNIEFDILGKYITKIFRKDL